MKTQAMSFFPYLTRLHCEPRLFVMILLVLCGSQRVSVNPLDDPFFPTQVDKSVEEGSPIETDLC